MYVCMYVCIHACMYVYATYDTCLHTHAYLNANTSTYTASEEMCVETLAAVQVASGLCAPLPQRAPGPLVVF